MIGISTGHAVATLLDSKKGSMTNRVDCAKEHFKNDMKTGVSIAVPTVGLAGAAYIKAAHPASKAAKTLTSCVKSIGKLLGKLVKKIDPKVAEKIMKNPAKLGVAGILTAAGIYVLDRLFKFENTRGRIDQKYEDSAKIESTTKNVVLDC